VRSSPEDQGTIILRLGVVKYRLRTEKNGSSKDFSALGVEKKGWGLGQPHFHTWGRGVPKSRREIAGDANNVREVLLYSLRNFTRENPPRGKHGRKGEDTSVSLMSQGDHLGGNFEISK